MHIGVRGDSKNFLDHQEKFFLEQFFPYLDEHNIRTVLDLGDTFDRRKYINYVTLKRSKNFFFDQMSNRKIEYHAIVGNHTVYFSNTNEINSMNLLLNEYENFYIYEHEPIELTFEKNRFMMVPWITQDNKDLCIRAIQETEAQFLLGHFEIKGFEMMKGVVCEHGIDRTEFSKFEAVYSGHFHHQSEYGNIRYLGAPYEMNWSDYNEKRGFHVFDTETRELTFIENQNRMHHKIEYDDSDMTIEELDSIDTKSIQGAYVKIIVKKRTNPYLYDLFINKLFDSEVIDVKSVEDSFSADLLESEGQLDETKDTKDMIYFYIDTMETNSNKNVIKKIIDELYTEAMSIR